jgi:hypothetical protein
MVTFAEFRGTAAANREFVNVLFEERVELVGTLQKLPVPLEQAGMARTGGRSGGVSSCGEC